MLGLGLIGGSVARAAVAAGMDVRAWTPAGESPRAAAGDGIVRAATLGDAVGGADLIVLAAPPLACLELIDTLGRVSGSSSAARPSLVADAVVTDVASTKVAIVERAREVGLRFVGGHPLAGRETTGYAASDPDLFRERPWVIVPPEPPDPDAEARVAELVAACHARLARLPAAEHDQAVAAISHLPLVLAAALTESVTAAPDWPIARGLAAGGWASMTRLAMGDVEMGAGILATNADDVRERLRALVEVLDGWSADLAGADGADRPDRLRTRLARAREALAVDASGE
jgi:prephenate dehydrogenase